jgi:hypothetical protein
MNWSRGQRRKPPTLAGARLLKSLADRPSGRTAGDVNKRPAHGKGYTGIVKGVADEGASGSVDVGVLRRQLGLAF